MLAVRDDCFSLFFTGLMQNEIFGNPLYRAVILAIYSLETRRPRSVLTCLGAIISGCDTAARTFCFGRRFIHQTSLSGSAVRYPGFELTGLSWPDPETLLSGLGPTQKTGFES